MRKVRNIYIDFLKLYMSIIILLYHYNYFKLNWTNPYLFRGGYLCVDVFFMISGFYLMKLFDKKEIRGGFCILKETGKRIKKLYPQYLIALLLSVIICFFEMGGGTRSIKYYIAEFFGEIFLIQEWGIYPFVPFYNEQTWYISAMIFGIILFLFLIKYTSRTQCTKILFISAVLGYLLLFVGIGNIHVHGVRKHISLGLVRGIADMAAGSLVYYQRRLFEHIPRCRLIFIGSLIALSAITVLCQDTRTDFAIILIGAFLILSGNSLENLKLKNKLWSYIGKLSYVLYLNQTFVRKFLDLILVEYSSAEYLLMCLLMAVFLVYTEKYIYQKWNTDRSRKSERI